MIIDYPMGRFRYGKRSVEVVIYGVSLMAAQFPFVGVLSLYENSDVRYLHGSYRGMGRKPAEFDFGAFHPG